LIMKLRPVKYQLINPKDQRTNWGFVAQDLLELVGENNTLVNTGKTSEDLISIRPTDLLAPMVKAIQEQQNTISVQKQKIEKLESENQKLLAKMIEIMKLLEQKGIK